MRFEIASHKLVTTVFVLLILARDLSSEAQTSKPEEDLPPELPSATYAIVKGSLNTFAQRRQWVIDSVAANPQAFAPNDQPFFAAEACFLAGKNDEGRELARKGYRLWSVKDPKKVRATDFFRLWPAMDCYVRWKQLLDDESKTQFRQFMTGIDCYSYAYTPNLSLLLWTTRYLGGQEWGDPAFVPPVRDTTSHYRSNPDISSKQHLLDVLAAAARTGGEEYASRPYGTADIAPFYSLSQLANDPEVKRRAVITNETILARYAPVWLRGALIITSRRSYPDMFNDPMGVASWFWVFFGGDLVPPAMSHVVEAAVLGTPPPAVIELAATDRSKPFAVRNRFQESSNGCQQSWLTKDYGLFSECFHNDPHAFGQTYPFGVRWIDPHAHDYSLLWFSVPALDQLEVPGKIRGSHPHGFDARAQYTYQHEGTLLYVCDTDKSKARFPYGLCFVPGGQLAMIDESATAGRVFLAYPGVLIAFTASKPFTWDRHAPLKMPDAPVHPGDSEFRVFGPTFAAALETEPASEVPGATAMDQIKSFRDTIVAKTNLSLNPGERLTVRYTDRDGNIISREFAGKATVNDKPVDFDRWPLADSPWVRQISKTAPLTVTDGKMTRTYDLLNWRISEAHDRP